METPGPYTVILRGVEFLNVDGEPILETVETRIEFGKQFDRVVLPNKVTGVSDKGIALFIENIRQNIVRKRSIKKRLLIEFEQDLVIKKQMAVEADRLFARTSSFQLNPAIRLGEQIVLSDFRIEFRVILDPKIDPDEAPDEPNIDPAAFAVEVVVVTAPEAATGFPPKTLLDEDVVVVTVVAPPKTEEAEVPDAGGAVPPNTDPAELVLAIDPNMVEADDDDAPPKTDPDEADVIVGAADPKVDPDVVVVVDADPKAVVDGVLGGFEPNTEVADVGAELTTEVAGLEEALPKAAVLVAVVDGLVVVTVLFTGLAISVDVPEGAIPNTDDPEEEPTVDVAPKIDPALLVIVAGAAPPKIPLEVVVEGVEENPKEGVAELVVLVIVPEASLLLVTAVKALIPKDREADVTAAGAVEVVGGFAPKGEEGPPPPPKLKDPNVEVEPVIGFVAETVEAVGFAILIVEATEAIGLIIADVEGAIDPKALLAANPEVPNAFPKVDETAEGAEATAANGGGGFATEAGAEGGAATGVKLLELETGANPELAPDEVNGLEGDCRGGGGSVRVRGVRQRVQE